MKPRHAAALVLAGWYLMMPPARNGKAVPDALPLIEWAHIDSFDSAEQCRNAGLDLAIRAKERGDQNRIASALAFECIATDDPRLKGH